MRPVQLGQPANDNDDTWVHNSLRLIEEASQEETEEAFDDYVVSNVTETRELDCSAATLDELRQVVGTMVLELQRRGNRVDTA